MRGRKCVATSLVALEDRAMNKFSAVPRRLPSIMKHKVSVQGAPELPAMRTGCNGNWGNRLSRGRAAN